MKAGERFALRGRSLHLRGPGQQRKWTVLERRGPDILLRAEGTTTRADGGRAYIPMTYTAVRIDEGQCEIAAIRAEIAPGKDTGALRAWVTKYWSPVRGGKA